MIGITHYVPVTALAPVCIASMCDWASDNRLDDAVSAVDLVSSLDLLIKPCLDLILNFQLPMLVVCQFCQHVCMGHVHVPTYI